LLGIPDALTLTKILVIFGYWRPPSLFLFAFKDR
jgi:hypothetical protein